MLISRHLSSLARHELAARLLILCYLQKLEAANHLNYQDVGSYYTAICEKWLQTVEMLIMQFWKKRQQQQQKLASKTYLCCKFKA